MEGVQAAVSPQADRAARAADRRRALLPIACILVLAIVLRLCQVGAESLWMDEASSIRDAHHITAFNRMRPLYYLILRFWMQFGQSEAWLRLPAVLFGTGAIAWLYAIAVRLSDRRTALLASILMTLSVSELDHSQEVRMYTLAAFTTLAALYGLLRWHETRKHGWLALFLCGAVLSLMTTPMTLPGLLFAAGFGLYGARREPKAAAALAGSGLLVLAAWAPLAILAKRSLQGFGGEDAWVPRPSLYKMVTLAENILTSRVGYDRIGHLGTLFSALFYLAAAVLIVAALAGRAGGPDSRAARMVALWFYGSVGVVMLYSLVKVPLWVPRYFQSVAPGLYLLLAMGITALTRSSRVAGLVAAGLLFGVVAYSTVLYYPARTRQDLRGVVGWVQSEVRGGDVVCLVDTQNIIAWTYYYRGLAPTHDIAPHLARDEHLTDASLEAMLARVPPHSGRTWLVGLGNARLGQEGLLPKLEAYLRKTQPDSRWFTFFGGEVLVYGPDVAAIPEPVTGTRSRGSE